jgi:hypothetical protein
LEKSDIGDLIHIQRDGLMANLSCLLISDPQLLLESILWSYSKIQVLRGDRTFLIANQNLCENIIEHNTFDKTQVQKIRWIFVDEILDEIGIFGYWLRTAFPPNMDVSLTIMHHLTRDMTICMLSSIQVNDIYI